MSEKIFHWTNSFKMLGEDDDGGLDIKGSASTNAVDRAGDIIEHDAWTKGGLENFKNNPVILFNHNYDRPIGRAKELSVGENGLDITARISKSANEIKDLIKDGVLGAFSVGFKVKDAEYMTETDGYKIKDAELFEVSVVSVPCNQNAVFSIAKSFDNMEEYNKFKQDFIQTNSIGADAKIEQSSEAIADKTETKMSEDVKTPEASPEFDLETFAKEVAEKTAASIAMKQAEQKAAEAKAQAEADEKAQAEAEAKQAEEQAEMEKQKKIVASGLSGAEKLMEDVEKRVNEKHEDLETVVKSLEKELAEKSEEIMSIRESKRIFADRGNKDWKEAFQGDILDAKILGLATGKGYETDYAKGVMQKVNEHSGVQVSSADFEQIVSTNVERDIQNELVLAPLFREIPMTSANMIIPILPDAGYAEFASGQTASGSSPHGNLAERGDTYGSPFGGVDLTERTLSTKKLISQSFLGNETEEDAILPILPLIRESIVRAHARGIENALLVGDHADGVYGTSQAAFDGLVALAVADNSSGSHVTQSTTAFASESLTAATLLNARKKMGKYGINPSDVIYIVNSTEYFNLLSDAEFQDVNLVGNMATKLNGEIGEVFGSKVIVCDEFATPATSKFYGVAVNTQNYVMPRLRGVTIESDYEVANQRRVLVASQRIGFTDMIDGATSVHALQYKAS